MVERIFDDGNLEQCRYGIEDMICDFEMERFYPISRFLRCD